MACPLYKLFYLVLTVRSESCSVVSDSLQPRGLYSRWNPPGQNTGVHSCSLLQGISKLGSPALQKDSLPDKLPGKPLYCEESIIQMKELRFRVAYPQVSHLKCWQWRWASDLALWLHGTFSWPSFAFSGHCFSTFLPESSFPMWCHPTRFSPRLPCDFLSSHTPLLASSHFPETPKAPHPWSWPAPRALSVQAAQ